MSLFHVYLILINNISTKKILECHLGIEGPESSSPLTCVDTVFAIILRDELASFTIESSLLSSPVWWINIKWVQGNVYYRSGFNKV